MISVEKSATLPEIVKRLEKKGVIPIKKKCYKCNTTLTSYFYKADVKYFYCMVCNDGTAWNKNSHLFNMKVSLSELKILLSLYIDNHSITNAHSILNSDYVSVTMSKTAVTRYFKLFSQVVMKFYDDNHKNILLEGHVEIDETQLYKEKISKAPGRPYEYSNIWLIGLKERDSSKFLIFPTEKRSEEVFIPILLGHVRNKSIIYTDSFSVYVNNRKMIPESKLEKWDYIHKFVNHSKCFVNEIFKDIHTNNIERFWRTVKEHIKKHKTRSLYMLCIGRFYFHRSLDKKAQLIYLGNALQRNDRLNEELDL